VHIHVEDLNPGGGRTILFLHGWPADHRMFEYQFDRLPLMGFRCVGMDLRGFGESDKPWQGYDYDRSSDDLRQVVEAFGLRDFTLAGHSTGGAIAVRYMARHGGYGVARLALCAAAVPSLIQRPYFPYGLAREDVERIIRNTRNDRPQMLREFAGMFFYQPITLALADWFFRMGLQAAGWSTIAVAESWLNEEELFSDLGRIRVPTLILHGVHDRVCLFPLAEAQNRMIPGSRLVPFTESGHGLFYDERDKFTGELARFAG